MSKAERERNSVKVLLGDVTLFEEQQQSKVGLIYLQRYGNSFCRHRTKKEIELTLNIKQEAKATKITCVVVGTFF